MDRRAFLGALGLLAAPLPAEAQPVSRIPRVGSLDSSAITGPSVLLAPLVALGHVEGKTFVMERRSAEGWIDRLPALARELVDLKTDVIVAWGVEPLEAVRKATSRIPIVMVGSSDPVATGMVASLAKPGTNITGVTFGGTELAGKRLQLLLEALPRLSRVAVLRDASVTRAIIQKTESAARTLNLRLDVLTVHGPQDLDGVFKAAAKGHAGAVLINESSMLTAQRAKIAELAIRNRMPVIGSVSVSAKAGLMMSYGADFAHVTRQIAVLVDKILKGARPGDLPFEQPTRFELVINLKTAKAIGLTIPPSLLQRADQVIE